jgi:hypothetical protein
MTEKLSKEQMAALRTGTATPWLQTNVALLVYAQAAVIERVRAECARLNPEEPMFRPLFEALAAAPEHTVTHLECRLCGDPLDADHPKGPCVPCHELSEKDAAPGHTGPAESETSEDRDEMARGLGFGDYATMVRMLGKHGWVRGPSDLAAANARVAELEREVRVHRDLALERTKEREAANARADAAEQKAAVACDDARSFADAANRAESERDDWKAKCEAAMTAMGGERNLRRLAEDEAEALRAELDRRTRFAESEIARRDSNAEWLHAKLREADRESAALRAEVERLRTEAGRFATEALTECAEVKFPPHHRDRVAGAIRGR